MAKRVAIPSVAQIDAVFAADAQIDGGRRASMVPATDAGVVAIAAPSGWSASLERAYTGLRRSLSFDIDADGETTEIASLTVDGQGTILWWRGTDCRIAWRQGETTRLVAAACGEPGGVGCVYTEGAVVCRHCDTERCGECTWSEGEARCDAIPAAPVAGEDVAVAEDVATDTGADDPGAADADAVDAAVEDGTGEPDVPSAGPSASCSGECLEDRGGQCCQACDCAAAGDCVPVCGDSYEWDCALGCCYNYDLFACACAFPAVWDGDAGCCVVDGRCLE